MRTSLGPGERPNLPIWVTLLNGKRKVSFGFGGMITKDGKTTALFQLTKTRSIKVEQVSPHEWKELPELKIGATVCIHDPQCEWNGKTGVYVEFNYHNEDGDFFGVRFDDPGLTVYFWRRDLEIISKEEIQK